VAGGTGSGKLPTWARAVGDEPSPTMSRLVRQMNLPSDNFYAEVLNKDIARFSGLTGSTWAGRYATRRYLTTNLQADMVGSRLIDGSGLSDVNRLSAHNILSLLRRAHAASYSYWFTNSLPLAGVSGTLANRMRTGPASHNARAKTGTLDDASNLSGYVWTANHHLMVFSILVNRPNLDISAAHGFQDRIVQLLAGARPL
jgi:D-alanyl-D-alanine carboxypeptidase/D-alanyl-D-alanine-endopeptidase (penicillin-binding protein 4)